MHYFYARGEFETQIELSKEESHHAFRVLRLKENDKVGVFNGEGSIYLCQVLEISKNHCLLTIESVNKNENGRPGLTIVIAPTKSNDRFEWFLEKATEIGVGEIIPLLSDRSERKKIRIDRLEKVIIAAMKQSMNPYLPLLRPLTSFKEIIEGFSDHQRYISHCYGEERIELIDKIDKGADTVILIGPEGDFSPSEIAMAEEKGWIGVSLGEQRFRTETAGIIAAHIYSLK